MGYYEIPKTAGAAQFDTSGLLKSGSLISQVLGGIQDREIEAKKIADENRKNERAEEVYQRQLLDQKATDAANVELAKGPQVYGGALNTQVAIDQANANSFTPEEIKKYDMYKDSKTARAAGENALADKMDWQTNLSNVADTLPGSGAANESRVQMYEGVIARLAKQGLPVPSSIIASADQARLFEAQETAATLKENSEAQAKNSADQIANAKYMVANAFVGNSGQQAVTDESGNVVGYTNSAAAKRDIKIDDNRDQKIGTAQASMIDELLTKYKDTAESDDRIADALAKYKAAVQADPSVDPKAAAGAILVGAGIDKGYSLLPDWISKDKATYSDKSSDKILSKLSNTITPESISGQATGSVGGSNKASAAAELSNQISSQQAGIAQQLRDERAKILRGADGRREDRVNEILMNAGLVKRPEVSQDTLTSVKVGSDGVRADRNNNPGNITGDDNWEGKSGKDGRFVQFKTYEDGSRALAKNLKNAAVGQTVQEYMSKYAPKSDNNDTDAYIKNVSAKLGIKPGDKIGDEHVWPLMQAIATQEGGKVNLEGLRAGYERVYPKAVATKADEILNKVEEEEGKTTSVSKDSKVDSEKPLSTVTDIKKMFDELSSKDLNIKAGKGYTAFTVSNIVSDVAGGGTTAYSSKTRAEFADNIRKHERNTNKFIETNKPIVSKELEAKSKIMESLKGDIEFAKANSSISTGYLSTPEFKALSPEDKKKAVLDISKSNKEYSEKMKEFDKVTKDVNYLKDLENKMSTYKNNKDNVISATTKLESTDKYSQDPSVAQGLAQLVSTGAKVIPQGRVLTKGGEKLLSSIGSHFGFNVGNTSKVLQETGSKAAPVISKSKEVVPVGSAKTVLEGTNKSTGRQSLTDAFNDVSRIVSKEKLGSTDVSELKQLAKDFPKLSKDIFEYLKTQGY